MGHSKRRKISENEILKNVGIGWRKIYWTLIKHQDILSSASVFDSESGSYQSTSAVAPDISVWGLPTIASADIKKVRDRPKNKINKKFETRNKK
jgi:hypothetical protein